MEIKHVYEVYSLVGGGYNKRHLHGHGWTKRDALEIANGVHPRRCYIGVVHVVQVSGRWHRIHVMPIESVSGDIAFAEDSRIVLNDLPQRNVPPINFELDGDGLARRLPLDLTRSIDSLASHTSSSMCRLHTARVGGKLPLIFSLSDLLSNERIQKQVVDWLNHEINFRLTKKAQDEPE